MASTERWAATAGLDIRRALPSDAREIAEIYNRAIEQRVATFETAPRDETSIRTWMDGHDGRHPILVAVLARDEAPGGENPHVVAWASLAVYRPRACYDGVGEFSIYVREGFRGKGIGHRLLMALIAEARAMGYWKLVARLFPQNTPSRRLVAGCGFREVGVYEKHGKLDGQWLDALIVERLIPENLI